MSDERQTDTVPAVDQGTRAAQAEDAQEERIQSDEEVIEAMRRQLEQLEERDRQRETEVTAERRRVADERRGREAAEARAREADTRAAQAVNTGRRQVDDAQFNEITTSLTAHQGQMEALKSQHKAAFAEGDGEKLAEIQAAMAEIGARIVTLRDGKAQLEARKAAPAQQDQATYQPGADEQRETFIRAQPSRVQDWLREHPQYFTDSDFQRRTAAAAEYASSVKRFPVDSQEYIDSVNQDLGLTQRQDAQRDQTNGSGRAPEGGAGAITNTNDRRMVAAPAGGSVPNTSRSSGGATDGPIHLSAAEREIARLSGVSERDYALAKRDLMRENQIGPNARGNR